MANVDDVNANNANKQIPKTYKLTNSSRVFTEFDAIFGQGGRANQYRNGTKFRQLIIQHSDAYSSIPSRDSAAKHKFVHQQVVDPLLERGGRFFCLEQGKVKQLQLSAKADARIMMTKIQQALRDERKRTRAHLRQKQDKVAKEHPAGAPVNPGPYDTVFGQNAQAKEAREGSVYEKLIGTLSETYHAMDQQYNHHSPYTKYDFVREQVVKPLLQQGGRFFYVKGGELAELKYHENTDCKVIMGRIQQAFDYEQKRKCIEQDLLPDPNAVQAQQLHQQQWQAGQMSTFRPGSLPSLTNSVAPQAHHPAAGALPVHALSNNDFHPVQSAQATQNMMQHNYHDRNAHPVIGATDTAMEALRVALQPSPSKASTQSPSAMSSGTMSHDSDPPNMPALTGTRGATPYQHDLGTDFDSHYSRSDTFFGSGLDHYHQKSAFCSLITQHSPAYSSIPAQDFRTRQEFVFNMIMEPLLSGDPGGRFFVLQQGVMKELDLYDEIDCRILLTNIQQAFFDEGKRRKKKSTPSPASNKAGASSNDHASVGDEDSDEGGMFSDAEESTVQPVLGIDEESVHALFETLRDKIQLTV